MAPQRHFLDWNEPLLPQAAQWLIDRGQRATLVDLASVTVVVPGRRAGRRLLETLAHAALERGSAGLVPPMVITLGSLLESLQSTDTGDGFPIAGMGRQFLARLRVLLSYDADALGVLLPDPPDQQDLPGWIELARTLERLSGELAIEGLDVATAARRLNDRLEFPEEERWSVLASIEHRTEALLARVGWQSSHQALVRAARSTPMGLNREVVLVGVADLGRAFRGLLETAVGHVHCLIHAPEEEVGAFDEWGCPLAALWHEREIDLRGAEILVVDRPRDQIATAVRTVDRLCQRLSCDQITIGLGEKESSRSLQEALALAGHESHSPLGRSFSASRPVLLLRSLALYVRTRSASDLAALLRHPDFEARVLTDFESPLGLEPAGDGLESPSSEQPFQVLPGGNIGEAIEQGDWLSFFDHYTSETLANDMTRPPGPRPVAELIRQLDRFVIELIDPEVAQSRESDSGRQPPVLLQPAPRLLARWSSPLSDLLLRLFGDQPLRVDRGEDAELIDCLARLGEVLREQSEIEDLAPDRDLSFPDAIALTLSRFDGESLSRERFEHSKGGAVEILGWLELPLDEADALLVMHLNEGSLPESVSADLFLPNQVRGALGLIDNRRRFARDVFLFQTLLTSRHDVTLIAGRRTAEDEPLAPSRLLLSGERGDDLELARRVLDYYQRVDEAPGDRSGLSFPHAGRLGIGLAEPDRNRVTERLSVTAFRDYMACPYRFYLRHVERLEALRDLPRELDGRSFGNLAHEILRRLSLADIDLSSLEQVQGALDELLETVMKRSFGFRLSPALRVQAEQLRRRLARFAAWQVEQARAGWTVIPELVEQRISSRMTVEGAEGATTFEVRGKVDRVDRHPQLGVRILDFKTSDRRREPAEVHRSRSTDYERWQGWTDLQLPLYQSLLDRHPSIVGQPIELGYCLLSADLSAEVWAPATWGAHEHEQALEVAEDVLRCIAHGEYWPPAKPPSWDDGFGWLCWDQVPSGPEALISGRSREAGT